MTQTPYERLKVARDRKARGVVALRCQSEDLTLEVRKEDLELVIAFVEKLNRQR